jgi:hypothetical protein
VSPTPDWDRLEAEGRITPSPGREEAVRKTLEHIAAKKAAKERVLQSNSKPRTTRK